MAVLTAGKRNIHGLIKSRTEYSGIFLILLFLAILGRFVYIQTVANEKLIKYAESRLRESTLQAKRGSICDRNGKPLAADIKVISVYVDMRVAKVDDQYIQDVAQVLEMKPEFVKQKLEGKRGIVYLDKYMNPRFSEAVDHKRPAMPWIRYEANPDKKSISVYLDLTKKKKIKKQVLDNVSKILDIDRQSISKALEEQHGKVYLDRNKPLRYARIIDIDKVVLKHVGYERKAKRMYPAGHLAAQLLGFLNMDYKGVEGMESKLEAILHGKDGKVVAERDMANRTIPETRKVTNNPVDGNNVYLTIDTTIQHITESAMRTMAETYNPEHAVAIVMDPNTGEILALANYPFYDANLALKTDRKLWRNRAVSDCYEPGSTQKVFTVAAALDSEYTTNTVFANCTGKDRVKGGSIPCLLHHPYEHGHGATTMIKIIRESCNIGAAHVALKLGPGRFYKYEEALGMTKRVNSGLGGEVAGLVRRNEKGLAIDLANNGFGQGLAVTPLHMATGYCVIANGGTYVQPQIIREIRDSSGRVISAFQKKPIRRVYKTETALKVAEMMVECVLKGTGKPAGVPGRSVAGKTGSAQIPKSGGGGYESEAFVSSFMGFAPAKNARLVIAVAVFKPKGSHWGSTVAAPVFKEIAEKSLWYLKVPGDASPSIKPQPVADKVASALED